MSFTQDSERQKWIAEAEALGVIFPPDDLWSDEPPLESELHLRQIMLLIQCLERWWPDRQDFYACGNMTIYYSWQERTTEDFRGPDFFVVLGTERKPRRSWMVWKENGQYPNVIVEILSASTASVDRGIKKQLYQDTFRTPEYFWFDPNNLEFKGFQLISAAYQALQPNENGWLWSRQLGLFLGVHQEKLRYFTPQGQLVLTPEEADQQSQQQVEQERQRTEAERQRAEAERQRAEAERQRAEAERQRADRLAERLRQLSINPDEI